MVANTTLPADAPSKGGSEATVRVAHGPGPALGAGRGPAGAAGRGGGRPGPLLGRHPPGRGRLPRGQDLRRLGAVAEPRFPVPTQSALRSLEWIHTTRIWWCAARRTHAAVEAGRRVAWFSLESLGVLVRRHRADDSVTRAIARILRADLSVVGYIGLLPVAHDTAEGLYRLVDAAYEKRSVAVSSNLHPSGFDEIMPKTLAGATVDRLLHHAHLCATQGDSLRLAQAAPRARGCRPWPHDRQIWWPWPRRTRGHHRAVLMSVTVQILLA